MEKTMTALVVVELTVRNEAARERYTTAGREILKKFGGELVAGGVWHVLFGEPAFTNGTVLKFADKAAALAWYNSPDYQALLADRALALDCRFRLLA